MMRAMRSWWWISGLLENAVRCCAAHDVPWTLPIARTWCVDVRGFGGATDMWGVSK